MRKLAALLAFSLATQFSASIVDANEQIVANKTKWPECFCTDRYGKRHEIGDIICLTVGGRSYMAKCIMAQNNPFWRDQNRGCLSSSLPSNKQPNMTPRPTQTAALYR